MLIWQITFGTFIVLGGLVMFVGEFIAGTRLEAIEKRQYADPDLRQHMDLTKTYSRKRYRMRDHALRLAEPERSMGLQWWRWQQIYVRVYVGLIAAVFLGLVVSLLWR